MEKVAEKIPGYLEWRKQSQEEFNAFPMGFAFNDEQFEEQKKKLGVKENDELISIGYGGFIRKVDKQAFLDMNKRQEEKAAVFTR